MGKNGDGGKKRMGGKEGRRGEGGRGKEGEGERMCWEAGDRHGGTSAPRLKFSTLTTHHSQIFKTPQGNWPKESHSDGNDWTTRNSPPRGSTSAWGELTSNVRASVLETSERAETHMEVGSGRHVEGGHDKSSG